MRVRGAKAVGPLSGKLPLQKEGILPLPNTLPTLPGVMRHLQGLPSRFKRALQANLDINAGRDALAEVSIDINPTNPSNLVICGHDGDLVTMNTFYTMDGGDTWTAVTIGNTVDGLVSNFRFDPSMVIADNGSVFHWLWGKDNCSRGRRSVYCRCVS